MNSPIILVVAWFLINLVLKSAKEKRKIEEAKRRRESQLGAGTTDVKRKVDTSRENLKKELQRAMAAKTNRPGQTMTPTQTMTTSQTMTPSQSRTPERPSPPVRPVREAMKPRETMDWKIREQDLREKATSISKPMEGNGLKIDFKKDLVKGIIFSEILSTPESVKNQKRSM